MLSLDSPEKESVFILGRGGVVNKNNKIKFGCKTVKLDKFWGLNMHLLVA